MKPSSTSYLKVQQSETTVLWTIDRPERRHAIGTSLAREMAAALTKLERTLRHDKKICAIGIYAKAVVIKDQATWVAGGDLKEIDQELQTKTKKSMRAYPTIMNDVCRRLEKLAVPVVVCIDGLAIGGGAELALAADIRLATKRSGCDFKQMRVGLATGFGGTTRLVQLVGLAHVQRILLTSARLDAPQCLNLGLFHELYSSEEAMLAGFDKLCAYWQTLPSTALRAQKKMLISASANKSFAAEEKIFKSIWGSEDHRQKLAEWSKR